MATGDIARFRFARGDLSPKFPDVSQKKIKSGCRILLHGTLAIQGAPTVPLRINHAATRERLSVVTTVCDDENAALQEKRLPIEVLFKGKTKKVLAALSLPAGLNISVAHAEKGSYREENVLNFLRRWLDEWNSVANDTCAWTPNSIVFCSSLLWNLLLLRLGAGLGKSRQVQASGIVSMYEWMDVWRRAHLSTGASREAPVDNTCFSPILTTRNPGISGTLA